MTTQFAWTLALLPAQTPCVHTDGKLTPSPTNQFAEFGTALDADGDVLAVGVPRHKGSAGPGQGAAFLYDRVGGGWSLQAVLVAFDAAQGDRFGTDVALDGDTVVVGSPQDDDVASSAGSAYVYVRAGCCWNLQAKLVPADGEASDRLGDHVALEGDRAVLGVPSHAGAIGSHAGAVYVYARTGTAWGLETKLTASDAAVGDQFGTTVALADPWLAVGAQLDDDLGFSSGSVYVFERTGSGWVERAKVLAPDGAAGHGFGHVVLDADTLVVGAPSHDVPLRDSGRAYAFRRAGSTWAFEQFLLPPTPVTLGEFGAVLALDGDRVLVGWPGPSTGPQVGSAFLFERDGSNWGPPATLVASDGSDGDAFGAAVHVDGARLLVGAPFDDDQANDAGSLYEFRAFTTPVSYCTGKTSSTGCVPFVSTAGEPSASAPSPFFVRAEDAVPQKVGFLLYGYKKANFDFHGGRLCVKTPFLRAAAKVAKPNASSACSGERITFNFNVRIQGGVDPLLTTGQRVFAQWLQRDDADPAGFGEALTDAVRFEICP